MTVVWPSIRLGAIEPSAAMWNIGGDAQKPMFSSPNRWNARIQVSDCASMFECVSTAPFGRPVVPDVYMISAGVSFGMSRGACASPSSAMSSS